MQWMNICMQYDRGRPCRQSRRHRGAGVGACRLLVGLSLGSSIVYYANTQTYGYYYRSWNRRSRRGWIRRSRRPFAGRSNPYSRRWPRRSVRVRSGFSGLRGFGVGVASSPDMRPAMMRCCTKSSAACCPSTRRNSVRRDGEERLTAVVSLCGPSTPNSLNFSRSASLNAAGPNRLPSARRAPEPAAPASKAISGASHSSSVSGLKAAQQHEIAIARDDEVGT